MSDLREASQGPEERGARHRPGMLGTSEFSLRDQTGGERVIKERVLEVGIDEAIGLFEVHKWKFMQVFKEENIVKIEVPRGYSEVYVVEIPFSNEAHLKQTVDKLSKNGFIVQTIRTKGSF